MGIFRKIVGWCELPSAKGATKDELYLSNEDLRPIVKEKRTWGSWTCTRPDLFSSDSTETLCN